ncbi:MAG: VanZ family protein [Gelidibacter sp.]
MRKQFALTLAVGYTLFLTVLSLIKIKSLPKLGSSFDDKIYHFGAYVLFTLLWYNFFKNTSSKLKIVFSAGIAFAYGIIVEVLQGTFTNYRTEDVMDVLANSFGVLFAGILIVAYRKIKLK